MLHDLLGELDAGVDAELLVHVAEVAADGEAGDVEAVADLAGGESFGDEGDHSLLGGGQAAPSGRRAMAGTSRAEVDPTLPQRRTDSLMSLVAPAASNVASAARSSAMASASSKRLAASSLAFAVSSTRGPAS